MKLEEIVRDLDDVVCVYTDDEAKVIAAAKELLVSQGARVKYLESAADDPWGNRRPGDPNELGNFMDRAVARINAFRRVLMTIADFDSFTKSDESLVKAAQARVDELVGRVERSGIILNVLDRTIPAPTTCPACHKPQKGRLNFQRSHPPSARCQHCSVISLIRDRGVDMVSFAVEDGERKKPAAE